MSDTPTPQKQRFPSVKPLTRKERRMLAANMRKWKKKMKPVYDAIEESTRITADDLRIIVRGPLTQIPPGSRTLKPDWKRRFQNGVITRSR